MEPARFAPRRSGRPSRFTVLPVAHLLALGLTLCLVGLQLGPTQAADLLTTLILVTSPTAPFQHCTHRRASRAERAIGPARDDVPQRLLPQQPLALQLLEDLRPARALLPHHQDLVETLPRSGVQHALGVVERVGDLGV